MIKYLLISVWHFVKMTSFFIISFFYFLIAALIRPFNVIVAMDIFKKSIHLFHRMFGLELNWAFKNAQTKKATNTVFVLLNQFSFLDTMVVPILPVPRLRGILNIEFGFYPVLGWFMMISNFVIVRQWPAQAKRVLNRSSNFLQSGGNMVISIEGKRSKDGTLNEYKKGPVVMAIQNQSDIVPFIIRGTYESLPMKSLYPKPGEISVTFLDPISTEDLTYEDRDEMKDRLLDLAHQNGLE